MIKNKEIQGNLVKESSMPKKGKSHGIYAPLFVWRICENISIGQPSKLYGTVLSPPR